MAQRRAFSAALPLLTLCSLLNACSQPSTAPGTAASTSAGGQTVPGTTAAIQPGATGAASSQVVSAAQALRRQGKPADAATLLRQALSQSPDDVELHREYQDTLREAGQVEPMKEEYANRLKEKPDSALAQYLYGRSLILEAPKEAQAAFRKAIQLDPEFVWGYLALGASQSQERNYFDASQTYESALKQFPDSAFVYLNLADARYNMKALRTALEAAEKATKLKPDLASAYELAGKIQVEQKDPDRALENLEKAVALDPYLGNANLLLTELYAEKGNLEKAKECATKAARAGSELSAELKAKLQLTLPQ